MSAARGRLLDALHAHGCKVVNGGRSATCPAHEDRNPSLSIAEADSFAGVVLACHAGCHVDDVLGALKLTTGDLFDEPRARSQGYAVVAEYPYVDEAGEVLFVQERRFPKDFRVKRRNGTGWAYSLGDTRRVLYRLPEVLAAVRSGQRVYVVEGEADADAVAALGLTATCNPLGAGKWRPEYGDMLAGADVVVLADRDEPGRRHAAAVAADLATKAASVRVVEPVAGKDVSDHLAAGHGIEELQPLQGDRAGAARPGEASRRLRLTAASAIPLRAVQWTWADRIPAGALTLIAGREGIGKSLALVHLAAELTRGTLPGICQGQPRPVIYAASEDSWSHTVAPRLLAAGADLDKVFRVDVETSGTVYPLTLPLDCQALAHEVRRTGTALLAIDPLASVLDGKIDTHRDRELREALEPLSALGDASGCAVVGLVHHGKGASTDPLTLVLGSRAFTAVSRAVHAAIRDPDDDGGSCILSLEKNNLGRLDVPALRYVITSEKVDTLDGPTEVGRLSFTGESPRTARDILRDGTQTDDERSERDDAVEWLIGYLGEHGPEAKAADIFKAAKADGLNERTLQRARKRAGVTSVRAGFGEGATWALDSLTTHSRHSRQDKSAVTNGTNEAPMRESGEGYPRCRVCGHDLWAPQSQAAGICARCTNARAAS